MTLTIRDTELEKLQKYLAPESSEVVRFGNMDINKSQIEKMKTISIKDVVGRPTNFGGVLDSSGTIDVIAIFQADKNQDFYFGNSRELSRYLKNSSAALIDIEPFPQLSLSSSRINDRNIEANKKGLPTIYAGYGYENAKVGVFEIKKYSEKPFFRKPSCEVEENVYSLNGKLETNKKLKFEKDGFWGYGKSIR